jgi:hypothetical protein
MMALTASLDEFWIDETWALIWSFAFAVCSLCAVIDQHLAAI